MPRNGFQELQKLLDAIGSVDLEPRSVTCEKLVRLLHSEPYLGASVFINVNTYCWLHGAISADFIGQPFSARQGLLSNPIK
jgi:hypothetical protein